VNDDSALPYYYPSPATLPPLPLLLLLHNYRLHSSESLRARQFCPPTSIIL